MNAKCPACEAGVLEKKIIPKHVVTLGGSRVEITNAAISTCNACGEEVVSAQELRRWERIKTETMASSRQVPSPTDVKGLREGLGISVSDFALLLGVTRQTIHAWERPDSEGIQLSPSSLLLSLLIDEKGHGQQQILMTLIRMARSRGIDIASPASHGIHEPMRRTPEVSNLPAGAPGFRRGPRAAA